MYAGSRVQIGGARCQSNPSTSEGEEPVVQVAKLVLNGQVSACSRPAAAGTTVANWETSAIPSKGFLIAPDQVTPVGG
jgi:hypothetical protein